MNNIVALTNLALDITEYTRCSVEDAETFLRETFRLAAEQLEGERKVEIPGLGVFIVAEDNIAFAPDQTLAAELNAPFAAFEAIELPDDYAIQDETADEPAVEEQIAGAAEFEEEEDAGEPEQPELLDKVEEPAEETAHTPEIPVVPVEPAKERQRSSGWVWFGWAASCIFCVVFGWFARGFVPQPLSSKSESLEQSEILDELIKLEESVEAEEPAAVEQPETPEPIVEKTAEPIVDTIAPGRFLTTMARIHYGRMEYWVYIYEANAAKLGHPDRLSSGTRVVIPSAESLGLKADDPDKIAEAERLATEIYARFN